MSESKPVHAVRVGYVVMVEDSLGAYRLDHESFTESLDTASANAAEWYDPETYQIREATLLIRGVVEPRGGEPAEPDPLAEMRQKFGPTFDQIDPDELVNEQRGGT